MLLRYYCMDWYPIPVKEEELLFNGTEAECQKYLLKNWIVDYSETPKELLNKAIHDIHHIEYLNINVKYKGGTFIPVHKLMDMEVYDRLMGHKDWQKIDASRYIFNKELISVTLDMNIISLFVTGFVLFVLACIPFKNDKLSREFLDTVHNLLFTFAFICWGAGLAWAMCV